MIKPYYILVVQNPVNFDLCFKFLLLASLGQVLLRDYFSRLNPLRYDIEISKLIHLCEASFA